MKYPLAKLFPNPEKLEKNFLKEFQQYACSRHFASANLFLLEGDQCNFFYWVLEGKVKILKSNEMGKEITIYDIGPGQSCLLTTFCIINRQPFLANAQATTGTLILEIPASKAREWANRFESWREFLFLSVSPQLIEMLFKIESLVFHRVDERIAMLLARKGTLFHDSLYMTHSEIAREVGTAREVVSRILKGFEQEHLIQLSRGKITILDKEGLLAYGDQYSYAG